MSLLQRTSVGSLIKRIHEINPELGVAEISALVRQSMTTRKAGMDDAGDVEVIDEAKAIAMARATLRPADLASVT